MKSEKAKKCIDANVNYHREIANPFICLEYAIHAVEVAEQEMQEKTIEIHKKLCDRRSAYDICYLQTDFHYLKLVLCNSNCNYMKDFINELNNK